jgi:PAS domain S-box-containing protein
MNTRSEHEPGIAVSVSEDPPAGHVRTRRPTRRKRPVSHPTSADTAHDSNPAGTARRWFAANTVAPDWLPESWRQAMVSYLLAALVQLVAVLVVVLLVQRFPTFQFPEALLILALMLVAFTWGAGPGVIATLVSAAVLYLLILLPAFSLALRNVEDIVGVSLLLVIGLIISAIASQIERARRHADTVARNAQALALSLSVERARLDAIIEAVPDAISIHDAQGAIVRVNRAGQLLAGAGHGDEALAETPQVYRLYTIAGEPFTPEQLPPARALRGEVISAIEMHRHDPEGHERYISVSAAPIRDSQGHVAGAVAVSHDVTALRQAEREATARAGELEAIVDSMADAVFVYDHEGRILRANAAARELFAVDHRPDYITRSLSERAALLHTQDHDGASSPVEPQPITRILRGEVLKGATSTDALIHAMDGREVLINVNGAPLRDAQGHITGAVAICRDVTERRQLERRTREALDALLAMAQALVLAPDEPAAAAAPAPATTSAVTRRLAELTCRVLGCQRVGILAIEPQTEVMQPLAVAGLPPEQERQWWAEQQTGARLSDSPDQVFVERLRAGEVLTFDMTQPPYRDQPNPYGIRAMLVAPMRVSEQLMGLLTLDQGGMAHDYTPDEIALAGAVARLTALVVERERLLRERADARANELSLREINRRMDEFLAIASHELKTPITTIKANVQLSMRRISRAETDEELLDKLMELLTRAEAQITRLNRLVDDLLDVSRIQTGKLELHLEPTDLVAIVREAVQEQRQIVSTRIIHLELPLETTLPIVADIDRIGQVVANYLTNALKYSAEDRPVTVQLRVEGPTARVLVHDEGPGLPPGAETQIWERFHQLSEVKVQSGSSVGLGLGLHISRTIIERHQGQVGVQSIPGQGATFWFTLPLVPIGTAMT